MTHYPNFLSASVTAFVTLALFACQFGKTEPHPALPPNHVLLEAHQILQATDGVMVRADSIAVSICPPTADCIAADNVGVKLSLSKHGQSSTVRLFTFIPNYIRRSYLNRTIDSTTVMFDSKLYKVILRDGRRVVSRENSVINQAIIQVSSL